MSVQVSPRSGSSDAQWRGRVPSGHAHRGRWSYVQQSWCTAFPVSRRESPGTASPIRNTAGRWMNSTGRLGNCHRRTTRSLSLLCTPQASIPSSAPEHTRRRMCPEPGSRHGERAIRQCCSCWNLLRGVVTHHPAPCFRNDPLPLRCAPRDCTPRHLSPHRPGVPSWAALLRLVVWPFIPGGWSGRVPARCQDGRLPALRQ